MRAPLPLPGLPIGRGDVWHHGGSRALLLGLAAAALMPLAGLVAVAAGAMPAARYLTGAVLPGLLLVGLGLIAAAVHERHLLARAACGLFAGWLGVLAYDVAVTLLQGAGQALPLAWAGMALAPGPKAVALVAPAFALHWGAMGALWGMAYALVAGKAHWGWGVATGAGLGALVLAGGWLLPVGEALLPGLTAARALQLALGHLLFGLVLGGVNGTLQPVAPFNAKIVFLRDYLAARERLRR